MQNVDDNEYSVGVEASMDWKVWCQLVGACHGASGAFMARCELTCMHASRCCGKAAQDRGSDPDERPVPNVDAGKAPGGGKGTRRR